MYFKCTPFFEILLEVYFFCNSTGWSIIEVYLNYALSILAVYFKYTLEVYFQYIWTILKGTAKW